MGIFNTQLTQRSLASWRFGALWVALACALGCYVSYRVVLQVGEPAVPLDDSYIHFNYARSFARLQPLVYSPSDPPTTGATSLGWVTLLSLSWAVGLRELWLIYAAWCFGWVCLGLLAWETTRVARGVLRPSIALTAGVMVLCFPAHSWFAASGMEVLPLAWLLVLSARLCADYIEASQSDRAPPAAWPLIAASFCAAITRPEGVIAAAMVAFTLFFWGGGGGASARRYSALALVGPAISPLLNLAVTGQALSATATAKLLSTSPYATPESAWAAQLENVRLLFGTLLNGEIWAEGLIPTGVWWLPPLGLLALLLSGRRRKLRSALILAVALGALIPTSYWTFLVNRLRYIWPFAAAWLLGVAALAELSARLLDRRSVRAGSALGVGLGLAAAAVLAHDWPAAVSDLVTSCAAITNQQVSLARWAKAELPEGAAIGVNDAGAMAYLSGHPTVDLVGLTTRGEARYWRAGPGPRFEHYEHSGVLPPYLILYPSWLGIDAITGPELTRRSVYGASILGSPEMVAFQTRFDLLGSGEAPPSAGKLIDRLDVCDLESEAAHAYDVAFAHEGTSDVRVQGERADGARTFRSRERFELELKPGGVLWLRGGADGPLDLSVSVAGRSLGQLSLQGLRWQEVSLELPADLEPGRQQVTLERLQEVWFATMHYWSLDGPS